MVAFILRCIFRLGLWLPVLVLSPSAAGDIPIVVGSTGTFAAHAFFWIGDTGPTGPIFSGPINIRLYAGPSHPN